MVVRTLIDIPGHVSKCLQLAVLLEVSAYPKPGNVHRTADFRETTYEHFLASAVALVPHFGHLAQRGVEVFKEKITFSEIGVGETVRNSVVDVVAWQNGKNTLLGSVLLLFPMAAASGLALAKNSQRTRFSINDFRKDIKSAVERSTPGDAVNVYEAITIAQPGGLGKVPYFDVTDPKSKEKILQEEISLLDVFKISAPWDSISAEWANNFHVTFDIGYPYLKRQLKETRDVNTATVHTFLKILSEVPDTLIARKVGKAKAEWVSTQASQVLTAGGLTTQTGRRSLLKLDRRLHDPAHKLNPGTTADLTSAALAILVLGGYRP
jgi:triphosphoribosyl-dephospho-CoA synthase